MYFSTIKISVSKIFFIFAIAFYSSFILNSFIHRTHSSPITYFAWLGGAAFIFPRIFRTFILSDMRENAGRSNTTPKVEPMLVFLFSVLSFMISMTWPILFVGLVLWQFIIAPAVTKYMESIKEDFAVEMALKKGSDR